MLNYAVFLADTVRAANISWGNLYPVAVMKSCRI